jgi:hypothetical protein
MSLLLIRFCIEKKGRECRSLRFCVRLWGLQGWIVIFNSAESEGVRLFHINIF